MLHRIKHAIHNNRTIVSNIFSLGTLQIFSYILPLITLPYITRVIWPEKYGIVAFAGAFVAYFLIFVNYGFNLTATRDISIHREDKNKVSEIFWNIMAIKLSLWLIATILWLILIYSVDIFSVHLTIFVFSLLAILGEILFSVWYGLSFWIRS
jgi:PST family polysaccharide transporter